MGYHRSAELGGTSGALRPGADVTPTADLASLSLLVTHDFGMGII